MTAALAASAAAAQSGQVAMHWMRAREGTVRGGEVVDSQVVSRERAEAVCRNLAEVQRMVDRHDRAISEAHPSLSGADHGRAVHRAVAEEVKERRIPGLRTEVWLARGGPEQTRRQADIVDRATSVATACIYDIKTGRGGWSTNEMLETMRRAPEKIRRDGDYVVVELRPTWRGRGRHRMDR
jgi:hypothetical protein